MNDKKFTVGLVQISLTKNPEENLRKAVDWVNKAADLGAQVICLPELFRTEYFCQKEDIDYFDLAESIPGPSTNALGKAALENDVVIVAPLFERRARGVYHNSLAVIDETGTIAGIYRKMHIPDDPAFYEKFYFAPGDLGYKSFNTSFGNIGTLICWDQWYPEAARLTALKGADVIFYPTAIGWHPAEKEEHGKAQYESWLTVQRGHAISNGVYVAAVNRIGHEVFVEGTPGLEFWGASFIADPQGIIIAQASHDKEEVLLAEIDTSRIEYIRRNWPFLRDRRIDTYDEISKRFIE